MLELQVARAAPAGPYIAFAFALYVWHVAAALLGAFIAGRLAIGAGSFSLNGDLKRMAACSFAALALFLALFYFAQHPAVFIVYLVAFLLSLKIAYLGESHAFLLAVLGAALAGLLVFVQVFRWLRLQGTYFLYLAALAVLIGFRLFRRRRERELGEIGKRREDALRERARREPEFITPCYLCLHYRRESARCQLRLDGEEVSEIAAGHRRLCASFHAGGAQAGKG